MQISKPLNSPWLYSYYIFGIVLLSALFTSIYFDDYFFLLVPTAILFIYLSLNDFRLIYFIMLATLPLSVETTLGGGFATDFPTEILMVVLMLLFFAWLISNRKSVNKDFIRHPIVLLLVIHFTWILITTIYSSDFFVSLKWSAAKMWYMVVFVWLTATIISDKEKFKMAFWCILIPLVFTILYTLIRHSRYNFSFESVNSQMYPFFRNHVDYAVMISLLIPFNFIAIKWYEKKSFARRFLIFTLLLSLVAVYLSYTRTAWVTVVASAVMIPIINRGWLRYFIFPGLIFTVFFFIYMGANNHFMSYAPDYERTIYHPELNEHLVSTFEGEDVSSVERIYRWIAGVRMWQDKPLMGFGPGNFYNFYKEYTVTAFQTYVSDNPEKSSIHNYFLQVLVEQGIIGLIIFLSLIFYVILRGERICLNTKDKQERAFIQAVLICFIILLMSLVDGDLVEAIKVGSFFFICIALLINQDIRNRNLIEINRANLSAI